MCLHSAKVMSNSTLAKQSKECWMTICNQRTQSAEWLYTNSSTSARLNTTITSLTPNWIDKTTWSQFWTIRPWKSLLYSIWTTYSRGRSRVCTSWCRQTKSAWWWIPISTKTTPNRNWSSNRTNALHASRSSWSRSTNVGSSRSPITAIWCWCLHADCATCFCTRTTICVLHSSGLQPTPTRSMQTWTTLNTTLPMTGTCSSNCSRNWLRTTT